MLDIVALCLLAEGSDGHVRDHAARVRRAVDRLVELGFITVQPGRGSMPIQYFPNLPRKHAVAALRRTP